MLRCFRVCDSSCLVTSGSDVDGLVVLIVVVWVFCSAVVVFDIVWLVLSMVVSMWVWFLYMFNMVWCTLFNSCSVCWYVWY